MQEAKSMSYSISTLLTRNLHDVFGETIRCVGALPSARSAPKIACSPIQTGTSTGAVTRSIASLVQSGILILTFGISQLPIRRKSAMAVGVNGYRALQVKHRLTPGLTSSLHG